MSIVEMSVQAGMLIITVVIVRAIALYRLPKTSFLALWGIVVTRMLIPFSVTSKWSVYNLFASVQSPAGGSVPVEPPTTAWGDPVQLPGLVLPGDAGAPSTTLAASSLSPLEVLWLVGMAVLFALFLEKIERGEIRWESDEPSGDGGREVPIDELDLRTGNVGDEIAGVRIVEMTSRFMDLSDIEYVEGDVGTEAHGAKIIG